MKRQVLPPLFFMIHLILIFVLHYVLPLRTILSSPYNLIGLLLLFLGSWLNIHIDNLLKFRKTTVKPYEEPSVLINNDFYTYSRNPMYLGMILLFAGIAVFLGSVITFTVPVSFFIILNNYFIPAEEKILENKFGEEYTVYKKRVRRWI